MTERQITYDCGGDAAAYALGALEPSEVAAFREHLEQCAVCRDEVEAFDGVVSMLPAVAPGLAPSRRLRRRVMRVVRHEPGPGRPERSRALAGRPVFSPRTVIGGLAVAALLAAVLLSLPELSGNPPAGRVIQAQVIGTSGSAQLRIASGNGELIVHRLPPPPAGQVYEVWLKAAASAPIPASVLFSVNSGGSAEVGLPRRLTGIAQVMVTAEPDGGTRAPTSRPVIVAQLS